MADPLSLSTAIISIAEVVSLLHDYGKEVKDAKDDICRLSQELFALKGVLDHLQLQRGASTGGRMSDEISSSDTDFVGSPEFGQMLQSTVDFLGNLLSSLKEPSGRLKRVLNRLAWPMTKADVETHIERLERVKSWFILALMTDSYTNISNIHRDIRDLSLSLKREQFDRQEQAAAASKKQLIEWLAPFDPNPTHVKACESRLPGTGGWFLRKLNEWLEHPSHLGSLLWLKGKSGSGKTTLFSSAVEDLKQWFDSDPKVGFAYFYCTFNNPDSQKPINVLGSVVAQLSSKYPDILKELRPLYEADDGRLTERSLRLTDLYNVLLKSSRHLDQIIICVDAVNESNECSPLIAALVELITKSSNVRIVATSTFAPSEIRQQKEKPLNLLEVDMYSESVKSDIVRYVEVKLQQEPNLRNLSQKLKDEIRTALVERADGMFRWVGWQIQYLCEQLTGSAVKKALDHLPQDLNNTYEQILERIPQTQREIVRQALLWLCFAQRPLTLKELCEAVVLQDSQKDLDEDDRLSRPNILLEICHGLINRDFLTKKIMLTHSSVRSFLLSEWIRKSKVTFFGLDPIDAQRTIMRRCVMYLCFKEFETGYAKFYFDLVGRHKRYPLLNYASHYWAQHANNLDASDISSIQNFLASHKLADGGNFSSWVQCLLPTMPPQAIQRTEPLYYAASFGLLPIVQLIVESGDNVNLEAHGGRYGSTALQVACFRGRYDVAKYLLEVGADPLSRDLGSGQPAVFWAKCNRWSDLVELMYQKGTARQ